MKTQETVKIRVATEQDRDAILAVHMNAFGEDEGPVIVKLVDEMLDDASGEPMSSLVAESSDGFVGHLLFTSVKIEPDNCHVSARILTPLAIVQNRQRRGIGGRLIQAGLGQLADSGVDLVFVLGYPDYYSRLGFKTAGVHRWTQHHDAVDTGCIEPGGEHVYVAKEAYSQSCSCFGVVASDDGTVDQVPAYRPRVSSHRLSQQVETLERVVQAEEFSQRNFREDRRWFEKHAFYLDHELCERVNHLFELGDGRKKKTGFILVTNKFKPHPDFDASFLR